MIESNSPHSFIHSDIWGEYSISNHTYTDNRNGVTTYLNNINGIPLFGGKGRKPYSWQVLFIELYSMYLTPFSKFTIIIFHYNFEFQQIHEDYGNKDVPPKLINMRCKKENCPGKCPRTWNILDDNKVATVINVNITCLGEIKNIRDWISR